MITRWRLSIVVVLLLASAAVSTLLLMQHHGVSSAVAAVHQVCGSDPGSGCDAVNRSAWAEVAGVPLAALGLAFAASLAALAAIALLAGAEAVQGAGALAFAAVAAALAVDLALLGVQAFSIHAFCRLCLLTYALNAASLALLWPARRSLGAAGALARGEGRLVSAGWLVATVAVLAGVAAAEAGLRAEAKGQVATLLGGPTAPASTGSAPSAAPSGDLAAQLQAAQQEARRLQDILDDQRKLEQYYAAKAEREYDQAPVQSLNLTRTPAMGPANAPVKVVVYSDFLCPFCKQLADALGGLMPQTQGKVALYYKDYPLDIDCNPNLQRTIPGHEGSCWLSLAGACATAQSRFWPYHDKVFANPPKLPQAEDAVRLAGEAGLDANAVRACIGSSAAREHVAADVNEAKSLQVSGTPAIFVNGRRLPRVQDFVAAVNKELQRAGQPPLGPPPPPQ